MKIKSATTDLSFLSGGGELGSLMRGKNWELTPAGDPSTWPLSLRLMLGVVLNSKFPMFIFWGKDHVCFYNDAYRPSLGENGKHPEILGQKAENYWAEIWHIIKPLIDQVLDGGEATWSEDQLIPIYRNGHIEDVYWTFSYSPIKDESGKPGGVLVTCTETTEKVNKLKELRLARNEFRSSVLQAPVGMAVFKGRELIAEMANPTYLEIIQKEEKNFIGKSLFESLPEVRETLAPLMAHVLISGTPFKGNEYEVPLKRFGKTELAYFNFVYQPMFNSQGTADAVMVVAVDVTELTLSKKANADAKEKLEVILNASAVGTWEWILKTDEVIYSDRYLEIFGFDPQIKRKFKHKDLVNLIHPDFLETRVTALKESFKTGIYQYEARLEWADKSTHWIEVLGKVSFDDEKKPVKLLGTIRDITDQKIAKQQLEESESRLRIAALSSELGTWDYNPATKILRWDNATRKLFDTNADTPVTLDLFWEKMHPADREPTLQKMIKALNPLAEDNYDAEYRVIISPGNKIRWIHAKGKAFFNKNNEAYLFAGTVLDITEKRIALNELEENEERFRTLSNAMPQFVWTSGADGILNYFNEAVYKYSGLAKEQVDKEGWLQIVHPDDAEENLKRWIHSIETGEPFLFEHRFRRHDGVYRWQLSRAVPQKDDNGNIKIWVGTSTDIDDIKKHEQQKNDFIKMANHELKTPVTTIKGYVQLLLKTHGNSGDALLSKSLATIDRQVTKLTNLISDLLDVNKIDAGKLPLNNEVFRLKDLLRETIKDIKAATQTHEIIYNSNSDANVFADKDRISQVLLNLFTNAFKYSPKADKIIIEINNSDDNVAVSVEDFGIGIDKEDQHNIFERFYRVAGKDEKTFPGFGIGLFIVKEIIIRHKGNLWVTSEKGQGSVFYFSLPIHS
jgi:PAS domain S-box-containing protein